MMNPKIQGTDRTELQEEPLLRVENLKTYYPLRRGAFGRAAGFIRALDGVSLDVNRGETVGIVGESGCGKSTLGRTILRLERSREGRIYLGGEEIASYSQRRMRPLRPRMQMIFQDPFASLNPRKTVRDLLAEPPIAHGLADRRSVQSRVGRLLEWVGLPKTALDRYPHEFSGGQRQRIGIARALSVEPELIVCDEPVSALDVSVQAQILNLLKDLQEELKLTCLFIAHGLGAVSYLSSRVAVMYLGKIVEIGPKEELIGQPMHPYTRLLWNSNPVADPRLRDRDRTLPAGDPPSPANPPPGCRFHPRCPYVSRKCREEEPPLAGGRHAVACHYPLD